MATETSPPSSPDPDDKSDEQSSSVPLWLVVLAVLALAAALGIILYWGHVGQPWWEGDSDKKFWDYLELLFVPAALALGVYWLNRRQDERDQQAEVAQAERAIEVENERAQDAAVQAYLDQLTQLLVTQRDQDLIRMQVDDEVRQVIQARSEALLRSLAASRRWSLILFLSVMGLLTRDRPLVSLAGADLKGVDGRGAPLQGVDLQGANLRGADLSRADLRGADLTQADLRYAHLTGANLHETRMWEADLRNASLRVPEDLHGAFLGQPDGSKMQAIDTATGDIKLLGGAIMPDGLPFADWLKSKDSNGDGKKDGSS